MKMTDIVPAGLIPALTWLGTQDWLTYRYIGGGKGTEASFARIVLPAAAPHLHHAINRIAKSPSPHLLCFNALAKALASGPKLLRATSQQCRAMEHVDVNVSFSDYQQPYPAVFLELPNDYRKVLEQRFAIPCPKYVLSFHDVESQFIFVIAFTAFFRSEGLPNIVVAALPPCPKYATVEDALREGKDLPADLQMGKIAQRISLNLCLLMTHYGVREDGPPNPGEAKALQRAIRRRKPSKADQARSQLAVMPTLISFKQEIKFCTEENRTTSNGDGIRIHGGGTPKKPHWRRGYFRHQRIGPGRIETKLTFIPPVFVNSDHFGGDLKDTEVVYKG